MATLTGKITDVTGRAPNSISSITVKAPSVRIGGSGGSSVIVSSPATVDFNRSTGDITISGLTIGLSWLYIEGDGWSDSIALAAADGMITLVEAVANASGVPGLVDYIELLETLRQNMQDVITDEFARNSTASVGYSASAGKNVQLNTEGKLNIATSQVTREQDAVSKGYVDQRVPITGTGSPEGKVAAPVGAIYTDTAATNGAIRWVKTSGAGSAGWRVEYGDTGWRNVTSLLIGDWTATAIQIRRENDLVTLRAQGLQGSTAGFLQLSAPFVTSFTNLHVMTSSKVENVFSNGSFALSWRTPGSINSDASYWAQGTWQVTSGWPTALPGTPV